MSILNKCNLQLYKEVALFEPEESILTEFGHMEYVKSDIDHFISRVKRVRTGALVFSRENKFRSYPKYYPVITIQGKFI